LTGVKNDFAAPHYHCCRLIRAAAKAARTAVVNEFCAVPAATAGNPYSHH